MTTVYGVTFIGAKKQIERQLKERGDIPAEHLYACSIYLGRIVLDSIGDVFKGATAIQTWLNRSARLVAKSIPPGRINAAFEALPTRYGKKTGGKVTSPSTALSRIPKEQMTSVVWTTPLGLPVVQPYRKPRKRQVSLFPPFFRREYLLIPLFFPFPLRLLPLFKLFSSLIQQFLLKLMLVLKLLPSLLILFTLSMPLI